MNDHILSEKDTQAVYDILTGQLGVNRDQLTLHAKIKEDLGADSLTIAEIALALEEHFNLSIPDDQWEPVSTVGDLFNLLAKLLPTERLC